MYDVHNLEFVPVSLSCIYWRSKSNHGTSFGKFENSCLTCSSRLACYPNTNLEDICYEYNAKLVDYTADIERIIARLKKGDDD